MSLQMVFLMPISFLLRSIEAVFGKYRPKVTQFLQKKKYCVFTWKEGFRLKETELINNI